jgi:hypothetical protein
MSERSTARHTRGEEAERLVVDRLRAVLAPDVLLLHGVRWLMRDHGYVREGEVDVVIGDPGRGILVIEVKAGEIRRDGNGTWHASEPLPRSPFDQARDSKHTLIRKLRELPDWDPGLKPVAGHAVAFPDVDLDSMRGRLGLLGFDAETELIADRSMFLDSDEGRAQLRGFVDRAFDLWGGKPGERPPGRAAIELLESVQNAPIELRSMLRYEISDGGRDILRLTASQAAGFRSMRANRRVEIRGGAGTGKTMFAIEAAARLAREGYETLLVCFNSALAGLLGAETQDVARDTSRLTVKTFHQLCEDLGREAGVLPPKPEPATPEWFSETLPDALDDAIGRLPGRYHAIVVDEGQDFAPEWLVSLDALLVAPREDVLYVFHDPAQAIFRDDSVAGLGLATVVDLDQNCRNTQPIHTLIERFAEGGLATQALRQDGRLPELIEADGEPAMLEALGRVLHRLRARDGEDVLPWDIAVLTGRSLEDSAVWRARRFGNEVLGNAAVDDEGRPLGLAAHLVPRLPDDVILCESIRRFKGLERPVVILVELRADDPRLERLLYVGASRATQHLVVIAPPAVLGRMR